MNKIKTLIFILLALQALSCTKDNLEIHKDDNFYRYYWGEKNGFKVWIIDGALIREKMFNEFLYGGNEERYPFVPEGEIWIYNSISAKEFNTTLEHEINERNLMAKYGMTYFDAHDSSLMLELYLRTNYKRICIEHEEGLLPVQPVDFDSTQEIESLPGKIKLKDIYRVPYGERDGIKIWIVDGFNVRRDIYPDFGFSGNGFAYKFIPENEIWIDGDISCEETEYSVMLEMKERDFMEQGIYYDDAYIKALYITDSLKKLNRELVMKNINNKPKILYRDTGTAKEKIK